MSKIEILLIESIPRIGEMFTKDLKLADYFNLHLYPLDKLNDKNALIDILKYIKNNNIEVALLEGNIMNSNGDYYENQANDIADYLKKHRSCVECWNISREEPVQPFAKLFSKMLLQRNINDFLYTIKKELTLFAMYKNKSSFINNKVLKITNAFVL